MIHGVASCLRSDKVYEALSNKCKEYLLKRTGGQPISYTTFSEELTDEEKREYPHIDCKHVVAFEWHKDGKEEGVEIFKPLYIYRNASDGETMFTLNDINKHVENCINEMEVKHV